MANHCQNTLYVLGDEVLRNNFALDMNGEQPLDFERVLCMPADYVFPTEEEKKAQEEKWRTELQLEPDTEENRWSNISALLHKKHEEKYIEGAVDWYNLNWGTKWIDSDPPVVYKNMHIYHFESAWSPPEAVCLYVSGLYPDLAFILAFEENGNCFMGKSVYRAGKELYHKCVDYILSIDELEYLINDGYFDEEDEGKVVGETPIDIQLKAA